MNFALKINSQISDLKEEWVNDADFLNEWTSNSLLISKDYRHIKVDSFESDKNKVWIIGDIIEERTNANDAATFAVDLNFQQLFKAIQGHYRVIVFNKESRSVFAACSLFGILPVYYIKKAGQVFLSSSLELLAKQTGELEIDKRFIMENILFYYPLFDNTIYKQIKLLPAHHQLKITDAGVNCSRYFNVCNWFTSGLVPWGKAA
ncbi:MAG: hypothetical protein HYR66_08760, partial [Sphingobacteriales bacterium]|nr:hypothetical protein [Sphingobacteriales bacterium]